ncbi:hypothetical protein CTI12_AA483430 [Artemisia annua]|uniref:Uncharacterized protein n=1 Tax=Artemisia annua TaxID=35608 RepID=A0A2U1LJK5_ARTAN|nr:hypothetical protein CTI12_AA483430 [Artemisia annua]
MTRQRCVWFIVRNGSGPNVIRVGWHSGAVGQSPKLRGCVRFAIILAYVLKEDLEFSAWIIALLMLIVVFAVSVDEIWRIFEVLHPVVILALAGIMMFLSAYRLGRLTNWLLYALPSDICNNSITNANCIVVYEYSGFLSEIRVMCLGGS